MLVADRLTRSFSGVAAVRDASFEIPRGQIVGFLGPNGAGKTTTMRMLSGFLPPSSGRATIAGFDTVDDSFHARRCVGYLTEANPLYPEMRVRSYLAHRATLYAVPRRERSHSVDRALERCRLADVRRKRIGALSKGYRQRVGLAAAILHKPPVLILDEPTSGLDPAQIAETRALLRELAGEHTVLLSTHILPEVERTCDRVIVIARGRIRADDTPADLLERSHPSPPYIVELRPASGDDPRAEPLDIFRAIRGVASAQVERATPDGWRRLLISAAPDAPDLREAFAHAARDHGFLVRELRRESASLEGLFSRLIERAYEGDAAPEEPSP